METPSTVTGRERKGDPPLEVLPGRGWRDHRNVFYLISEAENKIVSRELGQEWERRDVGGVRREYKS